MNRKKKIGYVLMVEILILLIIGINVVIQWRKNDSIDVSIRDWKSDYIEYDEINGWYVDEKLVKTEGNIDILSGPFISLKKGTYSVKVEYHCDKEQHCLAFAGDGNYVNMETGTATLSKNQDSVSYDFEVKEDIDNFEFFIKYSGKGYLQITNISIVQTSKGLIRNFVFAFGIFLCLDSGLLLSGRLRKHRNEVFALAGIILLTSLPLFADGVHSGHDFGFHLIRIEGIAREIRMGNLPVRLSSLWMDGYGYPVSVYYGDLLLYIPAVLRLLGFSITTAYKFYVFMINVGTAVITYFCMKKLFSNKKIALLTCLAYCTASYRLVNIYVRAAVGEYSAMMFLPFIALAVYKIYTDDISDFKEYRKNALFLAIGMSGLIGTHILSTEMVVFILLLICIFLLKKTFRKNTIKVYFLAVAETCAFSAYFIVPFLDYYINVPAKINGIAQEGKQFIQNQGASISEYFSFFRDIFSTGSSHANTRMLLTPGLLLMAVLLIAVMLWVNKQGSKEMKVLTVFSLVSLFVASNVFPWNHLVANYRLGNLLSQVQFPWRYISIATMILTLLLGAVLKQVSSDKIQIIKYEKGIMLTAFLLTCLFVGNYNDDARFTKYYDSAEIGTYSVGAGEYLRQGSDRYILSTDIYQENMQEVSIESRSGCYMKLRCVASEEEGLVWIPMFNYKGYHVTDENGREYAISDNYNNQIQFSVPAGFDGYMIIDYKEPWYWRIAEVLSLLSILGMCAWTLRKTSNIHADMV